VTEILRRQNRQTGRLEPAPAVECLGRGALHALIDRLTVAIERIEAAHPCATTPNRDFNPDGIPDTEEK